MLQQEMGWFDREANSTAALTNTLTSDAENVQAVSIIIITKYAKMS